MLTDGEQPRKLPIPNIVLSDRVGWMTYWEECGGSVDAVINKFHISPKTFYKWLKRYQHGESLENRSRRPHTSPMQTPKEVVDRLLQARKQTGYGPKKLQRYMEEHYSVHLSSRTIWKYLVQHRY